MKKFSSNSFFKTSAKAICAVLIASIFAASCKKETLDKPTPDSTTVEKISAFNAKLKIGSKE